MVATTVNTYMTSRYADTDVIAGSTGNPDGTAGALDGNMNVFNVATGVGRKGLCVRMTMPGSVATATAQQIIRLTITAL